MLKVTLVGAGAHSEHVHGPSLARYAEEHPGEIALMAVCDLREERGQLFREKFGFAHAYTDLDEMLDAEKPQACWVVAPIDQTRKLAGRVMERGVPVIFEKPPGQNLREAKELAAISALTGTPNQVAFNRRYAPCTQQAIQWAKEHGPFEYLYARMLRTTRMDETFAFGTGIHLLDCVRFLGEHSVGPVVAAQTGRTESAAGRYNFHVHLQFGSGAARSAERTTVAAEGLATWGRCDILPTCGMLEESYTLYGNTASIVSVLPWTGGKAEAEGRAELWVEGELIDSARWPAEPIYLSSGFYQEAVAFLEALRDGRRPSPSAEEAVASVALAEAVQEGREVKLG